MVRKTLVISSTLTNETTIDSQTEVEGRLGEWERKHWSFLVTNHKRETTIARNSLPEVEGGLKGWEGRHWPFQLHTHK